jgi:hypothetical protein
MKIGKRPFHTGPVGQPGKPGLRGVSWIVRTRRGIEVAGGGATLLPVHDDFLRVVDSMVYDLPDGDRYLYGTTYIRIIDASEPEPAGTWHYDTGLTTPTHVRNAGAPVLRFTGALCTTIDLPVSNLFSGAVMAAGRLASKDGGVIPADVVVPKNGEVVMFSEGRDLHARPARAGLGAGARVAFFSATLYTPAQTPDLSCPALETLRPQARCQG